MHICYYVIRYDAHPHGDYKRRMAVISECNELNHAKCTVRRGVSGVTGKPEKSPTMLPHVYDFTLLLGWLL
jgi:hypothetical protein